MVDAPFAMIAVFSAVTFPSLPSSEVSPIVIVAFEPEAVIPFPPDVTLPLIVTEELSYTSAALLGEVTLPVILTLPPSNAATERQSSD